MKQRLKPGAVINVDPADFSYMPWNNQCACGKPGTRCVVLTFRYLCEGCFFRYTVMEAAGRADEFWAWYKEAMPVDGWTSYKFKYSVLPRPDTTLRIRNIKADEAVS